MGKDWGMLKEREGRAKDVGQRGIGKRIVVLGNEINKMMQSHCCNDEVL